MDGSRKTSSLVTTGLLASIVVFSCGCEKKESGNNRQQILEQIRSGVNNLAVLDKDNPVAHQQDANALRTILKDDRFGLLQVRPDVSSPLKVRGGSIHGDATGITTGWTGYAGCGSTETSMYCATLPHVGLENLQFYDFADTFQTVPPGKGWKIIFYGPDLHGVSTDAVELCNNSSCTPTNAADAQGRVFIKLLHPGTTRGTSTWSPSSSTTDLYYHLQDSHGGGCDYLHAGDKDGPCDKIIKISLAVDNGNAVDHACDQHHPDQCVVGVGN